MKRDLDDLMTARDLDAIFVQGKVLGNPPLAYILDGVHLTYAVVVKKRDEPSTLIVAPMDRESAAEVGYDVILNDRYHYGQLLNRHEGDQLAASVAYYRAILRDLDVTGRVGFYGYLDQGYAYTLLTALNAAVPEVSVVGDVGDNLFRVARATKDADEVARIRDVGRRTQLVVQATVEFLQGHRVGGDETLRTAADEYLTVGGVHAQIRRLIAMQGLEDPEGFIFSTGRDAGIPHSRGRLDAPVRLGESIVFDIFPREMGGGYFFDMTRTFCLGYAPEPVARLHQDVVECLMSIKAAVRVGEETRSYQRMACAFFEDRGHPTVGGDPSTQEGYVHGVGHGVGLDVHEVPGFQDNQSNSARLMPGHVFALEPGLYYPDRGIGCRVEDMFWIDADGTVHTLTDFGYDLVVPMEKRRL